MLILCPLALIPCMSLGGKIMTINKRFVMPQYLLVYFAKNSTQYQKRQFVSIFVLIFMSFVLSRISTTHLRLDCVNYFSMWLAATQARLLNLRFSSRFCYFSGFLTPSVESQTTRLSPKPDAMQTAWRRWAIFQKRG